MTKLEWGRVGSKFYEAGVDRGVLYVNGVGVPWVGLISVDEKPTGGVPTPYYIDGFKYANVATAEEFEATIEAFSAPAEFRACDGTVSIQNGLFVTEQPKKAFGFAYRTGVGNDVDGLDHGYKLHLVYNALAESNGRTNQTLSDNPEPNSYSWDISTSPISPIGYRPTAHIVVDSRSTDPVTLGYLEGILYGAEGIDPRLPDADEIMAIMGMPNTGTSFVVNLLGYATSSTDSAVNLASNSSFERPGTPYEFRRNLAVSPLAVTPLAPANRIGWKTGRWFGSTPSAGVYSFVANAEDGPILPDGTQIETYLRKTWTVEPAAMINTGDTGFDNTYSGNQGFPVTPGDILAISGYVRPSVARNFEVGVYPNDASGVMVGSRWRSPLKIVQANTWERVSAVYTVPAGISFLQIVIDSTSSADNGAEKWVVGSTLDGTGLLVEKVEVIRDLFWGGKSEEDFVCTWVGTPNDSESIMTSTGVYDVNSGYPADGVVNVHSVEWAKSGTKSLRQIPTRKSTTPDQWKAASSIAVPTPTVETPRTFRATARMTGPIVGSSRRYVYVRLNGGSILAQSAIFPNVAGEHLVEVSWIHPAGGSVSITLEHGGYVGSGDIWWDDMSITDDPYSDAAFHGEIPVVVKNQRVTPTWVSATYGRSQATYYTLLETPGNVGDAYILDGNLWVFDENGYWVNRGPDPLAV